MSELPKNPFNNIAISMSGGGYRATAFHLGTLVYLSTILWEDKSLLERIRIMSTVSGGTFTGVKYASIIKNGGTLEDCYKSLVSQMTEIDLVNESLKYLADDSKWRNKKQRTLINAFALVYHEKFESDYLGKLWEEKPAIHLKEISFNATEFDFAIPFRFQKTEKSKDWNGNLSYGFIGNNKIRLSLEMAKEIRLADIIAASSCFPLGFEPINFPNDFIDSDSFYLKDNSSLPIQTYDGDLIEYPIGIMDGGVNDNQGIDAVWWAEKRMGNYPDEIKRFASEDARAVDLYIISDVSSPYIENFIRSEKSTIPLLGKCSFKNLKFGAWILLLISAVLLLIGFFSSQIFCAIIFTFFATISVLLGFIALYISYGFVGLTKKLDVPEYFTDRLKPFDTLDFNTYLNLIVNRLNSAKTMVSEVFMKRIRGGNYDKIYSDKDWRPRLIMNAVYELCPRDVEKRKNKYAGKLSFDLLNPSEKILSVSQKAKDMGTTLWFTNDELEGDENMLNSLIACGQYTVCFNLMEHIEKSIIGNKKAYNSYSPEMKDKIEVLYDTLKNDWTHFNEDPYFLVKQWNQKIK